LQAFFLMSDTVISVENLSKCYRLGSIGGGTLRADVSRWFAKLLGKEDPNLKIGQEHHARQEGQDFWALQNVSFEVKQGEILGVIGRNGAGKSTLLKILSRVTAPTSGEIKVKGRIASLLEVGTGFHPELSGRENIYLNGAILGMTKAEIKNKFDEIVDFSGVQQFLDTPVKRYSSGMYVRLAFAVAAHLEPEILIVDEVLAVGDAEFQKKCLGKMQEVSTKEGRTVLFVSHNIQAIQRLCTQCVYLNNGRVKSAGLTEEILADYLALNKQGLVYRKNSKPESKATITYARIEPEPKPEPNYLDIELTVTANCLMFGSLEFVVYDNTGSPIGLGQVGLTGKTEPVRLAPGENLFKFQMLLPSLAEGNYFITAQVAIPWVTVIDVMDSSLAFEIHRFEIGASQKPFNQGQGFGCIDFKMVVHK